MIPEERIKEEFEAIISERSIHRTLGLSSQQVRNFRIKTPSVGTMLDVLNRAGLLSLGKP
jgi:hypothetical protein